MMLFRTLAATCACFCTAIAASAATFQGSTSAIFGTPSPSGTVNSGIGTNQIMTGVGVNGSLPNSLLMTSLGFNTDSDTPFAVSNLTYHNGQTAAGTSATDLPVNISLSFTAPSGFSRTFNFTYHLDLTPNNNPIVSDPSNDDILTVPVVFSPTTFNVGGSDYTLELLGFSTDGGATIQSQFRLQEDADSQSTLFAQITAPPPGGDSASTPLPASAWSGLVLLSGFAAWTVLRRKALAARLLP